MRTLLRGVDDLLRGKYTADLAAGRIDVPVPRLALLCCVLGAAYGACMGLFAVLRGGEGAWLQLLASAVKVPALFLLTLAVTFPSLYVFSVLYGSRLGVADCLRLLMVAIGVDVAVLASFGPVTAFFTLSTESYPFMVLLNVAFFLIAGLVSLAMLRRILAVLFVKPDQPVAARGAADRSREVFSIWVVVYAAVGAQMGWVLRPFVGTPTHPFEWFRERESNFFEAVLRALRLLAVGG
jgi:hypothetical protein